MLLTIKNIVMEIQTVATDMTVFIVMGIATAVAMVIMEDRNI